MKLISLIIVFILSFNLLFSQPITGHETPPPNDPSCLTDVYGCTNWSSWSQNWISTSIPSTLEPSCNECVFYVNYKTRYCINDPTIVEIWVGAIGVFSMGCPCPNSSSSLINNPQYWKMTMYRIAAIHSFGSVQNNHICGRDEPMKYNMRFPGTCTMQCIYTKNGHYSVTGDIPCYPSGFCCGKTYIICYDDKNEQTIISEEITIGEHNCNYPTGNPPDWLCPGEDNGWIFVGATNCEDNCNYAGQ